MALVLLLVSHRAVACVSFYYSAADNRIYRFLPPLWQPSQPTSFATKNIALWAQQTGCRDTAAIREAIYRGTLADWQWASGMDVRPDAWFRKNAFVRRLKKRDDVEAVRLLVQSKEYECIRNQMRSPWYYNSRITEQATQLEALYEELNHQHGISPSSRYAARSAFLRIKVAWAAGADSLCLATWREQQHGLRGTIFCDEAEDYVARSLERQGQTNEAEAIYVRQGKRGPDCEAELAALQDFIALLDYDYAAYDGPNYTQLATAELQRVKQLLQSPTLRHRAEYQYAAACMLDYLGQPAEGLSMLQGAQGESAFLCKALRVLTFYLRSKVDRVDDDLLQYAIGEVQWLDGQMLKEWKALPDTVRKDIQQADSWWRVDVLNKFYCYAALRRTLLSDSIGLCYRLAEAGYGVRALQMANVADNHVVAFTHNQHIVAARHSVEWKSDRWGEMYKVHFNNHDYCNGLFHVVDQQSAATLASYWQHVAAPSDEVDRWMNARSYTNSDYWHDIIGTHYLREQRYEQAVDALASVSPRYQRRMNMRLHADAFSIDPSTPSHDSTHYKLHFAQRMVQLQQQMRQGDDDSRGLSMLEYSIGLENSFSGMCWYLTRYQDGYTANGTMDEYEHTQHYKRGMDNATLLRKQALKMLRTNDARARYYLRLGRYATVRGRYASTPTAQALALRCDTRSDHQSR